MGLLVIAQSLGASGAGVLADHVSTGYAAAWSACPRRVGGLWVLMIRRRPAGFDDDIEAPLRPVEVSEPLRVDLEARLDRRPAGHRADEPEYRPAFEPGTTDLSTSRSWA